jgi:hypothetical protein
LAGTSCCQKGILRWKYQDAAEVMYVESIVFGSLCLGWAGCSRSILDSQEALREGYHGRIGCRVRTWSALSFGSEEVAQAVRQWENHPERRSTVRKTASKRFLWISTDFDW